MKPTETPPVAPPEVSVTRASASVPGAPPQREETEEEAFYAAQAEAFADIRAHHLNRSRQER